MAQRNTYKQDERLEEPFNIRHLLLASAYIKKYLGRMIIALLISALGGGIALLSPVLSQKALDVAIPNKDKKYLFFLGAMLITVFVVSVILTTIRSHMMIRVSQSIIYDIRKDLFAHLQKLPFQ